MSTPAVVAARVSFRAAPSSRRAHKRASVSRTRSAASKTGCVVRASSASGVCIVKPSFIFGGDAFSVNPPRVTSQYGDVLVKILGSGFVKTVASKSPKPIALTLAEPVSVDDVAGAVCSGVFGRNPSMACDGTDEIKACAAAM